ncbi:MAG: hypothetical protein IPK69_09595 [Phycisphaerales bacterium]|nr:MAG: hypothetical protein IPK69_09595 [Phycisphaerales bacterium]
MKRSMCVCVVAGLAASVAQGQVVLNEVYPNPPGSGTIDDRWEYIEIYGPAGMDLTGYMVASVFGGGDPDGNDVPGPLPAGWDGGDEVAEIDEAWSLDGLTIGSNGLLVLYNNAQPSQALALFAPGTATATFQASHCPTVDVAGRIKNDGSATFVLMRKRPFHAINASGISLYDGVPANTITSGPLFYPSNIRYAWRKDINPDVDFNGRVDFNGIGSLVVGGGTPPAETPVNSERAATPPVPAPSSLEPYQMVDDVAWSNGGGKEYVRSSQQELSDTSGFNPDAASRVAYFGVNPEQGHFYTGSTMRFTRMADEEFIYGDILDTGPQSLPLIQYNPSFRGGPTDPNGPTYNEFGVLDTNGSYLLNDINLNGFVLTPGNFNDVDSSGSGGINITQFRFVAGDFNFDGVVNCDDANLIASKVGASLDDMAPLVEDNNTPLDPNDDIAYMGWAHQGRDFNALLAMIRMDLSDGTTGEWDSGLVVTSADVAAFESIFTCCVADVDDGSGSGTPDGGVTIDDLLYYLNIFNQGSIGADVDDGSGTGTKDGGVTIDDLLYFLARFNSGC